MGSGRRGLRPDEDWLSRLVLLADACAEAGDAGHARRLHDLLAPHAAVNVITERGWAVWGAAARPLGRLAALLGEDAGPWFAQAYALHREWGAEPFLALTVHQWERAVPGGPGTARLEEAREIGARLGLRVS
jgi:hypothetical protein